MRGEHKILAGISRALWRIGLGSYLGFRLDCSTSSALPNLTNIHVNGWRSWWPTWLLIAGLGAGPAETPPCYHTQRGVAAPPVQNPQQISPPPGGCTGGALRPFGKALAKTPKRAVSRTPADAKATRGKKSRGKKPRKIGENLWVKIRGVFWEV